MTNSQLKEVEEVAKTSRLLLERGLKTVDELINILRVHNQPLAEQVKEARHEMAKPLSILYNVAAIARNQGEKKAVQS